MPIDHNIKITAQIISVHYASKLVRVVVRSKQQQRLLELLDVKFEEMESLPESETVSGILIRRAFVLQDIHESPSCSSSLPIVQLPQQTIISPLPRIQRLSQAIP